MNIHKTFLTLMLTSLLLQACDGNTSPVDSNSIISTGQSMRLVEHMDNFRKASAYNGVNTLSIENILGDAADGEPTTRVEAHETRYGDLSEVFIIVIGETTEARSYIAQGKPSEFRLLVKGPSPDLGIEDDRWHVTTDQAIINDRLNALPTWVMQGMLGNPEQLEPAFGIPSESTHMDKACKTYRALDDKLPTEVTANFKKMFSRADAIEMAITLCEDGLPHLLTISGTGLGTTDPAKPAKVELKLEFDAFGNVRPVELPMTATPLELKSPASNAPASNAPEMAPTESGAAALADAPAPTQANGAPDAATMQRPLSNMNDGSYGTDEPIIALVTDKMPVHVDAEKGDLHYISQASLKDLFAFYQNYYSRDRGLVERDFVTSVFDAGFSIVFDGLPDGRAIVVQATLVEPERVNVNISKRKE